MMKIEVNLTDETIESCEAKIEMLEEQLEYMNKANDYLKEIKPGFLSNNVNPLAGALTQRLINDASSIRYDMEEALNKWQESRDYLKAWGHSQEQP